MKSTEIFQTLSLILIIFLLVSTGLILCFVNNHKKCNDGKEVDFTYIYLAEPFNDFYEYKMNKYGKFLLTLENKTTDIDKILKTATKLETSSTVLPFLTIVYQNRIVLFRRNDNNTSVISYEDGTHYSLDEINTEKLITLLEINNLATNCSYIRTYNVLNVIDSNDYNYIYLTLRYYQGEQVSTVKVLRNEMDYEENMAYEFTFIKGYTPDITDINDVFNYSKLINIEKTEKRGLAQRNTYCD